MRKYLLEAKLDKQDSAAVTYDKLTKAVESAAEEVLPKPAARLVSNVRSRSRHATYIPNKKPRLSSLKNSELN